MRYGPKQMMVLGAIQGGARGFDKISRVSGVEPDELNSILEGLEADGMIRVEERSRMWPLGKRVDIHNTERGTAELEGGISEMESKWGQMKSLYQVKDGKKLKGFMDDNRSFFPMMMFFGVVDMMMFSMMFSMIGSSMGSYVPAGDVPGGGDAADQQPGQESGQDYSDPGIGDGGGGFDFDFGF